MKIKLLVKKLLHIAFLENPDCDFFSHTLCFH